MPYWYCDKCGEKIEKADDGVVESYVTDDGKRDGLRLVHKIRGVKDCTYDQAAVVREHDAIVSDTGITTFMGHDGLTELLDLLAQEPGFTDPREVIRMISRLHTPGYERARPYFEDAIAEGVIQPNRAEGLYLQRDIAKVISAFEGRGE